ncbi:hypothetical protein OSB04_un000368 [Centaurea solstitialis]|uniref:Aldehyde oxidase GLOX n=1 Tax=Centaurea solstitialis TaxID=347529 RepID=A0AA38S5A1_9ASTR|nr:hypothetical protein OSB04_un000368 [Centaurea solstitialis]
MTTLSSPHIYFHLLLLFLLRHLPPCSAAAGGRWSVLLPTIGITAMHMQLLPNDRLVIFDRTDFGSSNISLPDGKCRADPNDKALKLDCTAHSVEYDVASNSVRPLTVLTDVWCSSGALTPDGTLVQTGGFNDGDHVVRVYRPCDKCDWEEIPFGLIQRRWYATSHILPDGRQIIIGGRRQFNYEFYPKRSQFEKLQNLPFLVQTYDHEIENNLYPFVFLHTDGNLFIFANNRAILLDYTTNQVLKTYPNVPGGDPRNYPSTGSAVLLPLKIVHGIVDVVEVLVCGGAPKGANFNAKIGKFDRALDTCGRIKISDPNPEWVMETMPMGRVMSDILLLPNRDVLLINGGSSGTAGWESGRDPVLQPVIYKPDNPTGSRFEVQNPSTIPRMYHSTAVLVRDGRVLVSGSNPHECYNFTNVLYPTELSLEAFSPSYLDPTLYAHRPKILSPITRFQYGKRVMIQFTVQSLLDLNLVSVTMVAPSFNTHSFSMNQRLLVLESSNVSKVVGGLKYEVEVTAPASGKIAPAGYYLVFVVHENIPSEGVWIHVAIFILKRGETPKERGSGGPRGSAPGWGRKPWRYPISLLLSPTKIESIIKMTNPVSMKDMHKTFAKLEKFSGQDFRRWQKKMHFYLTDLKVVYVLSTPFPAFVENETLEQTRNRSKWENADYICRGHILNGMSDSLFDVYQNVESAKELWDRLEAKYMAEDVSSKKFLVGNFLNYKMVDTRPVMEQYHELQRMLG